MLGTKITEEMKELDKFNLIVAKYRVNYGMSVQWEGLYQDMDNVYAEMKGLQRKLPKIQESLDEIVKWEKAKKESK